MYKMSKYFSITVILALAVAFSVSAQQIDHEATMVEVTATSGDPAHKNKLHDVPTTGREVRDSVTVTSVMSYFVMPDRFFNPAYFGQANYSKTDLTHSQFNWRMYSGYVTVAELTGATLATAGIAPQEANTTNTSPWVKVTWPAEPGQFTLTMAEKPQGVLGDCDGEPALIHVAVIAKPTIRFADGTGYGGDPTDPCDDSELFLTVCTDPDGTPDTTNPSRDIENWNGRDPRTIMFPVEVTTESGNVRVDYNLKFTPLGGNTPIIFTKRESQLVSAGTKELPLNIVHADIVTAAAGVTGVTFTTTTPAYGSYEIEIVRINDHVGRKSGVDGYVFTGKDSKLGDPGTPCGSKNVFTYIILPKPKPGRTFHVPNAFTP